MTELDDSAAHLFASPEELHRSANTAQDIIDDFREQTVRKFQLNPEQAGNDELTRALQTFQEDSSRAGTELAGAAAELADRLRATADDYVRIDAGLERALITALDLG